MASRDVSSRRRLTGAAVRRSTAAEFDRWAMPLAVAFVGLIGLMFGERVQAGGGLGWDGVIYADMARSMPSILADRTLSSYYAARLLAPVLAWLVLHGLDASLQLQAE